MLSGFGVKPLNKEEIEKQYLKYFSKIKPYIREPFWLINSALGKNKEILLEGAHGVFLDNNWGNYPYVTASNVMSAEGSIGLGIPPQHIKKIVGVTKAYATRVGFGPFPTELMGAEGDNLRKLGNEFGSTTGRPRRCGWLDVEMLRFAAKINGFTDIAITKMDILDNLESIKICVQYRLNGKTVKYEDISSEMLNRVKPVYITLPGWKTKTNGIKKYKDLPSNAKKYLKEMEKQIGVKVSFISTGAETESIIIA
jgi:adenylosuccinate synthase